MASDALIGTPIESLQQIGNAADEEAKGTQKGFVNGYQDPRIDGGEVVTTMPDRVEGCL